MGAKGYFPFRARCHSFMPSHLFVKDNSKMLIFRPCVVSMFRSVFIHACSILHSIITYRLPINHKPMMSGFH
jgi:hypothetical protein